MSETGAGGGSGSGQSGQSGEGSQSQPDRINPRDEFFCHECARTVNGVGQDITCPQCGGGFLEKLEPRHGGAFGGDLDLEDEARQMEEEMPDFLRHFLTRLTGFQPPPLNHPHHPQGGISVTLGGAGGRPQHIHMVSGDGNFQSILGALIHGIGGGQAAQGFAGNVGDYAWGDRGLDQIITDLLNQFESNSPHLSKEEIQAIPTVSVTAEQAAAGMQCSTCMEELKEGESVRRLPCQHLFHSPCITPWLESNNTCPICRAEVGGKASSSRPNHPSSSAGGGSSSSAPPELLDHIDQLD